MAEKKRKLPILGVEFDVSEVPIVDMHEYFNEYKLEDGTVLKVKGAVLSILRIDNQYLPDGNPVYIAVLNPVTKVESSPLQVRVAQAPEKVN